MRWWNVSSFVVLLFCVMQGASAFATGELAQTFTLDGQLIKANDQPLLDAHAKIVVQILDPSKTCLLYEEQQYVDTTTSNGYYNIQVGSDTGATKRTSNDPGRTMVQIYQDTNAITANSVTGHTCSGGAYTPIAGDVRYFRLTVTPSSTNVADTLSPDTPMDSVPTALVAQTLQGLPASQFLQIGSGDLTQANLQSVFASGNATKLNTLLSVNPSIYVTKDTTNGTILVPTVAAPASPQAGQIWYDAGALKYYNGTTTQTLGTSAGLTSVTAGTGLNVGAGPGGMITSTGTLNVDVGTNAGQIVQVQTGGKLPALDGSNLTGLSGTAIQSGTIGGTTAISTAGNIQTSADMTAKRLFLQDNGSNFVGLKAPSAVTTTYSLTFPAAQGGASTILQNDGSGNLSWVAANAGTVTSISVTAPITAGGTASAPIIGITKADATHDGYLASADWSTFNGKQSSSLTAANIWVGNVSNVATAVAPGGDLTMDNAGAFTVAKIRGTGVSSSAPTGAGQVMRYDGSVWKPNFVAMTDLRSSVTGAAQFQTLCTSGQTLTFNSVTDIMSCDNITVGASNFSSQTANTFLAAPNGSAGTPTFRTIAAADLPTASLVMNGGQAGAVTLGPSDANALTFNTTGAARMTIGATGDIGIGTTPPAYLLDVRAGSMTSLLHLSGTSNDDGLYALGSSVGGYVGGNASYNGTNWVAKSPTPSSINLTSGNIAFFTDSGKTVGNTYSPSQRMTLSTAGFLGLGISAPSYPLEISFTNRATPLALENYVSTVGQSVGTDMNLLNAAGNYVAYGHLESGIAANTTGSESGYMAIKTRNAGTLSEVMRVDNNGYLGIGTTAPGSRLDVNGALSVREISAPAVSGAGTGRIYFDSTSHKFQVSENGGGYVNLVTSGGTGTLANGSGMAPSINFSGDTTTGLYNIPASHTIGFASNGTSVATFDGTGMNISATTASVNSTSGALVVAGGVGVAGDINSNGSISGTKIYINGLNAIRFPASDSTVGGSIAVGPSALVNQDALAVGAYDNVAIGYQTMFGAMTTAATKNTAIGYTALRGTTSGDHNVAVGYQAGYSETTGTKNTVVGANALYANSTSGDNTAIGTTALTNATNSGNTAIGSSAGSSITSGVQNVLVGGYVGSTTLTTGGSNILIGSGSAIDTPASNTSNFLNIGNTIFATSTNTGTLAAPAGSVGIGTTNPQNALAVLAPSDTNGVQIRRNSASNGSTGTFGFRIATSESTVNSAQIGAVRTNSPQNGDTVLAFSVTGNTALAERMRIDSTGNVGIGTTAPVAKLDVLSNNTATSGSANIGALNLTTNYQPASAPAAGTNINNVFTWMNTLSTADLSNVTALGGNYTVQHLGGSNINTLIGFQAAAGHGGTGTASQVTGAQYIVNNTSTGTISNATGLAISLTNSGGGTITNAYGVQIGTLAGTNKWGVYQTDSTANNYFSGNLGIGTNAPATALDVNGALSLRGMNAPTASPAGQGRIYFDSTANAFMVSQNGGAYATLATTGGSSSGLNSTAGETFNSNSDATGSDGGFNFQSNGSNLLTIANNGDSSFSSTTASTSSTTGALKVAGGLGVAGAINSGSTISAATSMTTPQIYGSSAASGTLSLDGTSNLTKGYVLINPAGGNVGIGTSAPTSILSLSGQAARTFGLERNTTANTAGNDFSIRAGGATSGATNKAGGNLMLLPGVSTGSGGSGNFVKIGGYGGFGSSGTSDVTPNYSVTVGASGLGVATDGNGVYDIQTPFTVTQSNANDNGVGGRPTSILYNNYDTAGDGAYLVLLHGGRTPATQVGDTAGRIDFQMSNSTGAAQVNYASVRGVVQSPTTGAATGKLVFATAQNSTFTPVDRMTIDGSGNVGIGTTTPQSKIHVAKGSSGLTPFSNTTFTLENNSDQYLSMLVPTGTNEQGILFGNSGSPTEGGIVFNNSATANGFQFRTNGNTTQMVINSSGNVGIGTTGPTSALSVVNPAGATTPAVVSTGAVVANQFTVSSGSTIDFSKGNAAVIPSANATTTSFTLSNMVAGGAYTVIIHDTGAHTYTFSGCTTSFQPTNAATSGSYSIYSILYFTVDSANVCAISWVSGF